MYVENVSSRYCKSRYGVAYATVTPSAVAAGPACMRVGVERREPQVRETMQTQIKTERAWDVERRRTPHDAGVQRGVQTLTPVQTSGRQPLSICIS
jgi:hypothetical protein